MWKELEMGNISQAAQIQQLGLHLYMGLSVETGIYGGGNVQKWFPIVNRQKVTVSSFNEIMVKESTRQLKAVQLSLEVYHFCIIYTIKFLLHGIISFQNACDSTCALILLQGNSSVRMLNDFLRLRSDTAISITQSQSAVKQKMQNLIQFLVSSVAAIHAVFVGMFAVLHLRPPELMVTRFCTEGFPDSKLPQGLLSQKLKTMCQSGGQPIVQLLPITKGLLRQLPPIITEFRCVHPSS